MCSPRGKWTNESARACEGDTKREGDESVMEGGAIIRRDEDEMNDMMGRVIMRRPLAATNKTNGLRRHKRALFFVSRQNSPDTCAKGICASSLAFLPPTGKSSPPPLSHVAQWQSRVLWTRGAGSTPAVGIVCCCVYVCMIDCMYEHRLNFVCSVSR